MQFCLCCHGYGFVLVRWHDKLIIQQFHPCRKFCFEADCEPKKCADWLEHYFKKIKKL